MTEEIREMLRSKGINCNRDVHSQILTRMGYRKFPTNENWFVKPFSSGMCVIERKDKNYKFSFLFKGANNKPLVWDSKELNVDPQYFQESIASAEKWNTNSDVGSLTSDFGFFTSKELAENSL